MISVVFSTKNGSSRLKRTLSSFCKQDYEKEWELLIVDNGSTDDSCKIIEQFSEDLPIRLLHQAKPGKNCALNLAIEHVKGEIIVFTDDDVRAEVNWLSQIEQELNSQGDFDIFGGAIEAEWEVEPQKWILDWAPLGPLYAVKTDEKDGECDPGKIWGPNMVVRKRLFDAEHQHFNENIGPNGTPHYPMGSETEFTKRMHKRGYKCYFSNKFTVHHWVAQSSLNKAWIFGRAYRLGKGVTLAKFTLGEKIQVLSLLCRFCFYFPLRFVAKIVFDERRVFWINYKSRYLAGALRGALKGYLGF